MALQDNAKNLDIRPKTGSADESPKDIHVYDPQRGGHYPINEKQ